jgi:hypothetical protein
MMEALSSFETSVLTRAAWRNIPEDGNLFILPLLLLTSGVEAVAIQTELYRPLSQHYRIKIAMEIPIPSPL